MQKHKICFTFHRLLLKLHQWHCQRHTIYHYFHIRCSLHSKKQKEHCSLYVLLPSQLWPWSGLCSELAKLLESSHRRSPLFVFVFSCGPFNQSLSLSLGAKLNFACCKNIFIINANFCQCKIQSWLDLIVKQSHFNFTASELTNVCTASLGRFSCQSRVW